MGVEPTAARNATRHRFWRPGNPPGPNHSQRPERLYRNWYVYVAYDLGIPQTIL